MIQKIKSYLNYVLSLAVVILGYLAFNRNRKLQQAESELAQEKSTNAIKDNEEARLAARAHADELVDEYEKLRGNDR